MRVPAQIIRLLMLTVLGAALLLLSAVAERGETEMSRALVRKMSEVPEMIEALLASAAAVTAGGAAASYIEKNGKDKRR